MMRSFVLPGGADRLVLVPTHDGYCKAMVAEQADGAAGWTAYPPEGDKDTWVAVRIEGGTALANSYSGWLIRFDPKSGHELERHFNR